MKIHKIHDNSNQFVMDLLNSEFNKIIDKNILQNYHPNFSTNPANIFYILNDNNCRYKKGCYYIIEENDEFICSAGWNEYEYDKNIALALTRAYVNPKYRAQYYMGNYILPLIIAESLSYENLFITCNSYNDVIYQFFLRASMNKKTAMFNDWPEIYKKFKPIGKKTLYFTEQYVAKYKS